MSILLISASFILSNYKTNRIFMLSKKNPAKYHLSFGSIDSPQYQQFFKTASENQPIRIAPPSDYLFRNSPFHNRPYLHNHFFVSSMKHTKTVFQHFSGTILLDRKYPQKPMNPLFSLNCSPFFD